MKKEEKHISRVKYGDLQEKSSKILEKIAENIIGPKSLFIRLVCEDLKLPYYTVKNFVNKTVNQEYLLYNYGKLERSIIHAIDQCSDGSFAVYLDPEFVQTNRALFEDKYLSELRQIHEEAMKRSKEKQLSP